SKTAQLLAGLQAQPAVFVALNKIDIASALPEEFEQSPYHVTKISALTGAGISELKTALLNQFAPNVTTESNFIARSRHVDALKRAEEHLAAGQQVLLEQSAGELFAEELRYCHEALIEITGEYSSDDLLGEIFSTFCIGK
ncbi:MAG: tRNA modification GTPase, partial [Sulfitobacter sp.]